MSYNASIDSVSDAIFGHAPVKITNEHHTSGRCIA